MELIKKCSKGSKMNCSESFFIQIHKEHGVLIDEQKVNDFNPIYAKTTKTRLHNPVLTTAQLPAGFHARSFTIQGKPITWLRIRIASARLYTALHCIESCNLLWIQTPQGYSREYN